MTEYQGEQIILLLERIAQSFEIMVWVLIVLTVVQLSRAITAEKKDKREERNTPKKKPSF